jgi:hypothetical protein
MNTKAKIKVVDSIMGQGKTTWAINYMKNNPKERFMYITPFLDEVERVKQELPKAKSPYVNHKEKKAKLDTLRDYTFNGDTIVTTHALLSRFDLDIQENIQIGEYTLILDEVASIAEEFSFKTETDKKDFFDYYAYIDEDGYVRWDETKHPIDKYSKGSKFYEEMVLCLNGHLLSVNDKLMMWELPVNIFKQFKEVFILTYLFQGSIQKPYFDLYNVEYEYLSIKQGELIPYEPTPREVKQELSSLINIVNNDKLNSIGDEYYALSSSWFRKNVKKGSVYTESLRKRGNNFFKTYCKGNAKDNMVTTLKEKYSLISDKGWSSSKTSYVSFNVRATNNYIHKKNLAYILNVFPHASLAMYFSHRSNKISIDEDDFALSILIQWIWRSRIRNQSAPKEDRIINLYIPSKRMRYILQSWLELPLE